MQLAAGSSVVGKVRLVTATGDEITNDVSDTVQVSQATHDNLNLNANLQVANADNAAANPAFVAPGTGQTWDVSDRAARDLGKVDVESLDQYTPIDVDTDPATVNALPVTWRKSGSGGPEFGTSSNPVRTDPTGTTTQPVSDGGGSLTVDQGVPGSDPWVVDMPDEPARDLGKVDVAALDQYTPIDVDTDGPVVNALPVTWRKSGSGGPEFGTPTNPVRMDPTGTTTQPVSGTMTANQGTAGAQAWPVDDADTQTKLDTLNTNVGTTTDVEAAGDGSLIALVKRLRTLLAGGLPAALTAGGNLKAAILEAIPTGANVIGKIILRNAANDADIAGDAANGLDVDVTRLPALVAGSATIGNVGIVSPIDSGNNVRVMLMRPNSATQEVKEVNPNADALSPTYSGGTLAVIALPFGLAPDGNFDRLRTLADSGAGLGALAVGTPGELLTLASSAARVASGNGTAVTGLGWRRRYLIVCDLTAAATDAGDTLDVYVDLSLDGSTWLNAVHFTQFLGNGGAKREVAVLDAAAPGAAVVNVAADAGAGVVRPTLYGAQMRARWTIVDSGDANQSFTFSVVAYAS